MRSISRTTSAALALFFCLLTAADATAARGTPPAHPHSRDRLLVALDDGAGTTASYELLCHVAGGTHHSPQDACARLDELGGPVPPVEPAAHCTMVYGGPETARVTGSWRGAPVNLTYRRTNGCENARWAAMFPVLPAPRGDTSG